MLLRVVESDGDVLWNRRQHTGRRQNEWCCSCASETGQATHHRWQTVVYNHNTQTPVQILPHTLGSRGWNCCCGVLVDQWNGWCTLYCMRVLAQVRVYLYGLIFTCTAGVGKGRPAAARQFNINFGPENVPNDERLFSCWAWFSRTLIVNADRLSYTR